MTKTYTAEAEICELQKLFQSQRLDYDSTNVAVPDGVAERVYQRVITADGAENFESDLPHRVLIPANDNARLPSTRVPKTRWVLAACLALALAIGLGLRLRTGDMQLASNTTTPIPTNTVVAGLSPLAFDADLTDLPSIPSAEDALAAARRIAEAAGQPGQGDVQFMSKIESIVETWPGEDGFVLDRIGAQLVESWLEPNGAMRIDNIQGPLVDFAQSDQLDFAGPFTGGARTDLFPAPTHIGLGHDEGLRTPWIIADLPRDPAELRNALLSRSRATCQSELGADRCIYYAVTELFREYVIPNDLAAAMWAVLADTPIMHSLGETTDRLGRPALGFAVDAYPNDDRAGNFFLLLISPETGQLIGWEEIAVNHQADDSSEPTVVGFTVWVEARFVENVGDRAYIDQHNLPSETRTW